MTETGISEQKFAYTIKEFCRSHGISRATFYRMELKPDLMRVGKGYRISQEAAARWRTACEVAAKRIRDSESRCCGLRQDRI